MYEDELERFGEVSSSIEEKGFFSVLDLLESKSFYLSFTLPEPMASGKTGEDRPVDDTPYPNRAMRLSLAIPEMICIEVSPP